MNADFLSCSPAFQLRLQFLLTVSANPRQSALRVALWTFLVLTLVTLLALLAIGGRLDPKFNATGVTIGYIVSFFFWYGLHWLWAQIGPHQRSSVST